MTQSIVALPTALQAIVADFAWDEIGEGESDARVFRLQQADTIHYLKVAARDAQFPVARDKDRLGWLANRVPVPAVLHYTENDTQQFLLMSAVDGLHPMHDDLHWSAQERISLLAEAARCFHALPVVDCPFSARLDAQIEAARHNVENGLVRIDLLEPQWQNESPQSLFEKLLALKPAGEDLVVVHGDMYPFNIRVHPTDKTLLGYIDVGAAGVGDRYTDLAVIVNALTWHLGTDAIEPFFRAYGIESVDTQKLQFYQLLNEFF